MKASLLRPARRRSVIVLAVALAGVGGGCSTSPDAPREEPISAAQDGATEAQYKAYLQQSTMNFPGMAEAVRKQFMIPPRPINLPLYYIQEFEVTNREFKDFVDATGYRPIQDRDYLAHWEQTTYPEWATDFPVVWVSVSDAESYCRWRKAELPSEEQWEKASRGTSGFAFPWGNQGPNPEMSNFSRDRAEPVGNRAGDVSPFQVYDLAGNVREWTSSRALIDGTEFLIIRGGSFALPLRDTLSTRRNYENADQSEIRMADVGFRCSSQ